MSDLTEMVDLKAGTFTWGPLVKIHHVANFEIVEFIDDESNNVVMFHPFVEGKDTREIYCSLKEAIVGAIVYEKNSFDNSHRDVFFVTTLIFKMIGGENKND